MGFEFKSDQPEQKLVDNTTTLSVNKPEDNLTQPIFAEGEEEQLAIQFIEENALYTKFMLWCGLQDQLKKLSESIN
jgi:hypothetical protein